MILNKKGGKQEVKNVYMCGLYGMRFWDVIALFSWQLNLLLILL